MDIQTEITDRALKDIRWSVEKLATKGLLKEPSQEVLARISPEKDLSSASKVDWVIEAAFEAEELKLGILESLTGFPDRRPHLQRILLPYPSRTLPKIRIDRRGSWGCISSGLCQQLRPGSSPGP
jgi:hypothetical protein